MTKINKQKLLITIILCFMGIFVYTWLWGSSWQIPSPWKKIGEFVAPVNQTDGVNIGYLGSTSGDPNALLTIDTSYPTITNKKGLVIKSSENNGSDYRLQILNESNNPQFEVRDWSNLITGGQVVAVYGEDGSPNNLTGRAYNNADIVILDDYPMMEIIAGSTGPIFGISIPDADTVNIGTTTDYDKLVFLSSPNGVMTLYSTSMVRIGTGDVGATLDILSAEYNYPVLRLKGADNQSEDYLQIKDPNDVNRLEFESDSSDATLKITNSTLSQIDLINDSTDLIISNYGTLTSILSDNDAPLYFGVNNNFVVIDQYGHVGINASLADISPGSTLSILDSTDPQLKLMQQGDPYAQKYVDFRVNADEDFCILPSGSSGGKVAINNEDPNATLDILIPSAFLTGMIIKGADNQTEDYFQIKDPNDVEKFVVEADGDTQILDTNNIWYSAVSRTNSVNTIIGSDSVYGYAGTSSNHDFYLGAYNNAWIKIEADNGYAGFGSGITPDSRVDIQDPNGPQLRLTHTDVVDYSLFQVNADGDLSITSSGGDISFDNENLTTAGTLTLDNPGASVDSPILYLKGDHSGVEETATLQLLRGTDPYLRISVTDDSSTPVLTSVFDVHDTVIAFSADNTCDIGGASDNRPKNIYAAGDLYIYGDDLFMTTNTLGSILVGDGTNFNPVVMSAGASIAADGAVTIANDGHAHTGSTLSGIDISDDTNLTAGDALTLTDDDIDFDGGASPGGELGGTWASPTIDDSLAVTSWNLTTPTLTTSATVTDSFTLGLGSGKGLIQFDDETTDFVSIMNANVGIGTTGPEVKLDVQNAIVTGGSVGNLAVIDTTSQAVGHGGSILFGGAYTGTTITTAAVIRAEKANSVDDEYGFGLGFYTRANGGGSIERMLIDSTGKVGIGTTEPDAQLNLTGSQHFTSAGSTIYSLPASGEVAFLSLAAGGSTYGGNGASIKIDSAGALADGTILFFTNQGGISGAERMRITNTGKVGIGTTDPNTALNVKGTLRLSGSTSGYVGFAPAAVAGSTTYTLPLADGNSSQVLSTNGAGVLSWATAAGGGSSISAGDSNVMVTDAGDGYITFTEDGSEKMRITGGNVGIGTTTPSGLLHVEVITTFSATGGTITTSGNYTIHTFTSSGTFTPNGTENVEYLVVAGGGGGGGTGGGGGGGGGLLAGTSFAVTAQAYTITVGEGGSGSSGIEGTTGSSGTNSVFSTLTAIGGGGGGSFNTNGASGGSGGGGGEENVQGQTQPGGVGTEGQGNDGGYGQRTTSLDYIAGGGGGAGAAGGNAGSGSGAAGSGGIGIQSSINGTTYYFAGGGGGGNAAGTNGVGGNGGNGGGGGGAGTGAATGGSGINTGGTGGTGNSASGGAGGANTGGGGGGSTQVSGIGGNGGSGIVIIRYLTPITNAFVVTLSGRTGIGTADPNYSFGVNGTIQVNANILPGVDSTSNLGATDNRFANTWSDLINGADYGFLNSYRILEAEKYEGYPKGIAIGNKGFSPGKINEKMPEDVKPLFVVCEEFIEYNGVRITKKQLEKLLKLVDSMEEN